MKYSLQGQWLGSGARRWYDGIKALKPSLAIADLEDGELCQDRGEKANCSISTMEQIDMSSQMM